jgi:hypothetical protein
MPRPARYSGIGRLVEIKAGAELCRVQKTPERRGTKPRRLGLCYRLLFGSGYLSSPDTAGSSSAATGPRDTDRSGPGSDWSCWAIPACSIWESTERWVRWVCPASARPHPVSPTTRNRRPRYRLTRCRPVHRLAPVPLPGMRETNWSANPAFQVMVLSSGGLAARVVCWYARSRGPIGLAQAPLVFVRCVGSVRDGPIICGPI